MEGFRCSGIRAEKGWRGKDQKASVAAFVAAAVIVSHLAVLTGFEPATFGLTVCLLRLCPPAHLYVYPVYLHKYMFIISYALTVFIT